MLGEDQRFVRLIRHCFVARLPRSKQYKVGYVETRDCRSIETKRFRKDIRGHARKACESRFYLHRAASAQGVVRANIVLPVERAYLASMFEEGRGAQV